jgi:hypothetical protein
MHVILSTAWLKIVLSLWCVYAQVWIQEVFECIVLSVTVYYSH